MVTFVALSLEEKSAVGLLTEQVQEAVAISMSRKYYTKDPQI